MQDARVLELDEPTSALSEKEVRFLFQQMRRLKEKNVAIIFISHRLNEIEEITDSLTVLRDGYIIADGTPTKGLNSSEIIAMMVGRSVTQFFDGEKPQGTGFPHSSGFASVPAGDPQTHFENVGRRAPHRRPKTHTSFPIHPNVI